MFVDGAPFAPWHWDQAASDRDWFFRQPEAAILAELLLAFGIGDGVRVLARFILVPAMHRGQKT